MDAKGRLAIPARHRAALADPNAPEAPARAYITRNPDPSLPCLSVYPVPEWHAVLDKLAELPNTPQVAKLRALLVGSAKPVDLDKQGRVLVSSELRESLGLGGDVAVVGAIKTLQLWNKADYDAYLSDDVDLSELLATVSI